MSQPGHELFFEGVPPGYVACARCKRLFTLEQFAATPECWETCQFCGNVREPVHICVASFMTSEAERSPSR